MKDRQETDKLRLNHILESIQNIIDYTSDIESYEEFNKGILLKTSCEKWIEEIGEAVHFLSNDLIEKYNYIPW
jgi:uncharacterized protein with HEPN domain